MSQANHATITSNRPLPALSRRSALSLGIAAAAGATLTGGPVSAQTSPIAALFEEYRASEAEAQRLGATASAASDQYKGAVPPVPDELQLWGDRPVGLQELRRLGVGHHLRNFQRVLNSPGCPDFWWMQADGWRAFLAMPSDPDHGADYVARRRRFAAEQVALADQWEAERAAIDNRLGYSAKNRAEDAALDRTIDLLDRVMEEPARSLADLAIQASIVEELKRRDFDDVRGGELAASVLNLATGGANG